VLEPVFNSGEYRIFERFFLKTMEKT